jgi:ABC-type transport system substrate-binding protein
MKRATWRPNITWHDGTPLIPEDFVLGWTMVRDTDAGHGTHCPSEANRFTGFNSGCYSNPENDRVADALKTEIDPAQQIQGWRALVKLQSEDVPVVPMFFLVVVTVFREGVTGVKGDTKPRAPATWNVAEWDVR